MWHWKYSNAKFIYGETQVVTWVKQRSDPYSVCYDHKEALYFSMQAKIEFVQISPVLTLSHLGNLIHSQPSPPPPPPPPSLRTLLSLTQIKPKLVW